MGAGLDGDQGGTDTVAARVGNDELSLIEAKNSYQNALVDLQALLGLSPVPDFALVADGAGDPEPVYEMADLRDRLRLPPP